MTTLSASADDSIDVQLLSSRGEHYKAMLAYDRLPKRKRTLEATIADARSAWALSLPQKAIQLFDEALEQQNLPPLDRARILFSRGIIEYQEGKYQVAALYGERSQQLVSEAGPFRARVWMLRGESAAKLGNFGSAEDFLQHALEESSMEDEGEIRFQLGEACMRLNKITDAEEHFKAIPVSSDNIPKALRRLAEIALMKGEADKVIAWIEKGKKDFPDQFLDGWVSYALMQAAIKKRDILSVRKIRDEANKRYAPSEFWLSLMNASAELVEWNTSHQTGGAHGA